MIYYTCDISSETNTTVERIATISTSDYPEYELWDSEGQPAKNSIPVKYGNPIEKKYAKIAVASENRLPLN